MPLVNHDQKSFKPIYRRYIDDCHSYTKIGSYYKTETGGQNNKHKKENKLHSC